MEGNGHKYTARPDREASKRFDKAAIRFYWKEWAFSVLHDAYRFGLIAIVAIGAYAWQVDDGMDPGASVFAMVLGGVLGALWSLATAIDKGQRARDSEIGEVWECEMTDEGWSSKSRDGVLVSYPWRVMRLAFSHQDGYLIEVPGSSTVIDRKPLVDAGLEEMFLAQLRDRESGHYSEPRP